MDPPTKSLVDLLTLVLKCNIFEFNTDHYLQVQGTAIGTQMASSYANIFMGYLKKNQLLMLVYLKPHMWLRFTDDIDIQWRHSRKDLHEFLDKAKAFNKTIKFTSEISNDNHVFLDTKSHIEGSQLVKDLY